MSFVNVCQGCLSSDRKLFFIGKHAELYQQLLLIKSRLTETQLLFCWECKKILDNILEFRLKITQAQKILISQPMLHHDTLSKLAPITKVEDYIIVIYNDIEKIPVDVQVEVIKDEKQLSWDDDKANNDTTTIQVNEETVVKEELKNEEYDVDIIDYDDMIELDNDVKKESDEDLAYVNLLNNDAIEAKPRRRKRGALKQKYRTIIMEDIPDKRKLYDKVKIDQKTLEVWLEKKKKQTSRKAFQCEKCFCGFSQQKFYDRHLALRHSKILGRYECDVCAFRFSDMNKLAYHVGCHYTQFVCKLCNAAYPTRGEIYLHFTHGPHGRLRECKKCGLRFDCRLRREFFDHYRQLHEQFVCDYCGKRRANKKYIDIHIRKYHTDHRCNICNVSFRSLESYVRHNKRKHVVDATEHNYCVECNMQFINSTQYGEHIRSSVKHRANRAIPCPECNKVYTKRISMTNHYDLVHLKKSKYHCEICDTYYLNGYRLRYHQKYFHEKRPKAKNKLCKYCGRGFNNNRILENHMRTHTGERPFACAHCPAAFAQKQALKTHVKSAHK